MTTDLHYDPADPQTRRDPFPLYQRLQDEDPVHWSESLRCWIITRYDDVRQVALTPDMSSNRLQPFYDALKDERRDILSGVMRYLNLWLVFRAPPEHTRVRRLLNSVFTPALIASMQGRITETVEHILAPLESGRPVEFMHEVAVLLPAYVILDMLSVPRAHFSEIKKWSDDLRLFIGTARGEQDKYARARDGADRMADYFREVIRARRAVPGDDVVSRMIAASVDGNGLTDDELVATCMLVLFGGHETTTNLLGSALKALIENPAQRECLRADPSLIDSAVEEFLRFDGPSNSIARVVARDHEVAGRALLKGDRVFAMINAANRDPRRFERPHELDLTRSPNRHLTFGQGLHFCLGAPLARLEAKVCLGLLVQRYPHMRAAAGEVDWIDSLAMRGPITLPVHLD
jgi:cytochrome P450